MTDEEMQFCRETIKNAIDNENFGFLEFDVEEVEDARTYDGERMFELKLVFKEETTLRSNICQDAYIPKYIRVSVNKRKGYDQNEVGAFYNWEEGFKPKLDKRSFSCSINLIGHYRRYRGKRIETWVGIVPTRYTYGTELDDIHLEYGFESIAHYMRNSSYSKTQLVKK